MIIILIQAGFNYGMHRVTQKKKKKKKKIILQNLVVI